MGLFDFLRKGGGAPSPSPPADKNLARLGKIAADKLAQAYDRMDALQALAGLGTPEAAAALLRRFTFTIDPTITDEEEKDVAVQGVLKAGEGALDPIRAFCARAESIAWPLRLLRRLLDDERYTRELVALLERFDTEYIRNVEPKLQLLGAMEELKSEAVRRAVEPFLDDVNETVRFRAVEATFAQDDVAALPALLALLDKEESVRIKNRVADGLERRGWRVPGERVEAARRALADAAGFEVRADGTVRRR